MPTKISLVMTGAVSLGSFEAGVLTELLHALDSHSRNGNPYELDVITGASAGAMTAGLVAHAVMNDYSRRANLYRAWVELVTIDALLENPPPNALLSEAPIRRIADQCITGPFTTENRSVFAPETLRVALTLSNLNGYDRNLKPASGPPFVSTFFDDRKTFRLTSGPGPESVLDEATWEKVRVFSIASGAFPVAFPPSTLERALAEYDDNKLITQFSPQATYVDGGTFNNQPIGEAVRLCREADADTFGIQRKYIFVNASVNNSMFVSDAELRPTIDMPPAVLKRVADVIFNESRTSDWIRALLINDQVVWRDQFLDTLIKIVQDTTVTDTAGLIGELTSLARTIVAGSRAEPGARVDSIPIDELLQKTRTKYKAKLDAASSGGAGLTAPGRTVLELIFFALDHIADLDDRKKIDLFSIAPAQKLAGEQLQAFGGFFKQEYRQYNFRYGRQVAYEQLSKPEVLGAYPKEVGTEEFQQYDIPPGWRGLPDESLRDMPKAPRQKLRDALVERAKGLIDGVKFTGYWIPDAAIRLPIRQAVGDLAYYRLNALLEL